MAQVVCLNCGEFFEKLDHNIRRSPRHFCSRSCSASNSNKRNPKRKRLQRKCAWCRSKFTPSTKGKGSRSTLCPPCRKKRDRREVSLGEYHSRDSVTGKHSSWKNSHIRLLNRSWNKHLVGPCEVCGYAKHVELCHIRPITDFPPEALLKEVNSESNNVVLCRNHHWEFDHHRLDPGDKIKLEKIIADRTG